MPSIRVNEITSSTVLIIIFLSISESYINLASSIIIHLGHKFVTSISLMVSTTGSKNIKPSLSLNRARVNNHSNSISFFFIISIRFIYFSLLNSSFLFATAVISIHSIALSNSFKSASGNSIEKDEIKSGCKSTSILFFSSFKFIFLTKLSKPSVLAYYNTKLVYFSLISGNILVLLNPSHFNQFSFRHTKMSSYFSNRVTFHNHSSDFSWYFI